MILSESRNQSPFHTPFSQTTSNNLSDRSIQQDRESSPKDSLNTLRPSSLA